MSSYHGQELTSILEQSTQTESEKSVQSSPNPYLYHGLLIYPYRPDHIRVAFLEDFYFTNGHLKIGMDFLVISCTETFWEAHKVGEESIIKWGEYIMAGRIYVKDESA
jgi:hypothetical protein